MSLYAAMLKIDIRGARARVRARFTGGGSVSAETVATGCDSVECDLFIDSDEEPERIAKLVRVSEAGCFAIQSLRAPVDVRVRATLNDRLASP